MSECTEELALKFGNENSIQWNWLANKKKTTSRIIKWWIQYREMPWPLWWLVWYAYAYCMQSISSISVCGVSFFVSSLVARYERCAHAQHQKYITSVYFRFFFFVITHHERNVDHFAYNNRIVFVVDHQIFQQLSIEIDSFQFVNDLRTTTTKKHRN